MNIKPILGAAATVTTLAGIAYLAFNNIEDIKTNLAATSDSMITLASSIAEAAQHYFPYLQGSSANTTEAPSLLSPTLINTNSMEVPPLNLTMVNTFVAQCLSQIKDARIVASDFVGRCVTELTTI